jgi:putative ABC transport system substrate-binding protein
MRAMSASARITRRRLLAAAAGAVASRIVHAQASPARVGFLSCDAATAATQDAFRAGMRDAGLVEGRQYTVAWRFATGDYARLPELAAQIVSASPDVIVAVNTLAVQAARSTTRTLPIVMIAVPDPIGEGFAASLSRPGGNITGLSNIVTEVSVKHLELLHLAVPKISHIALLNNPQNPSDALVLEQVQGAAYTRKLKVMPIEARNAADIDNAFAAMAKARVEAVIVAVDAFFEVRRDQIIEHTRRQRLPSMFATSEMTEAGGLMSYGQDLTQHYKRAAGYVDRILKGTSPAVMPIEQPTVLEFVVNRKAAAMIGLALPPQLLLRADKIIE